MCGEAGIAPWIDSNLRRESEIAGIFYIFWVRERHSTNGKYEVAGWPGPCSGAPTRLRRQPRSARRTSDPSSSWPPAPLSLDDRTHPSFAETPLTVNQSVYTSQSEFAVMTSLSNELNIRRSPSPPIPRSSPSAVRPSSPVPASLRRTQAALRIAQEPRKLSWRFRRPLSAECRVFGRAGLRVDGNSIDSDYEIFSAVRVQSGQEFFEV
jgi:hypothetical protein